MNDTCTSAGTEELCVCVCVCVVFALGMSLRRMGKKTTWFIAFSLWVQCSLHVFAASLWVAFTEHGQHGPESLGRQSTRYNQMQPGSSGIKVLIHAQDGNAASREMLVLFFVRLNSIYLCLAVIPFQLQAGGGLGHEPQVLGGIDLWEER